MTRDDQSIPEPSLETDGDIDAPRPKRQAQGMIYPMKMVIEDLQANECIEGWRPVWQMHGSYE